MKLHFNLKNYLATFSILFLFLLFFVYLLLVSSPSFAHQFVS